MPNPSSSPVGHAFKFLVGFALAWILLNTAATCWIRIQEDAGNAFLPHQRNINAPRPPVDTLFLGNSFSSSAIQPELLQGRLPGWVGYNHSILVGGVSTAHMALNHWLGHQPPPRTIVWTISHFEMSGKGSIVSMKFEQEGGLGDLPWIWDTGPARGRVTCRPPP